MFGLGLPELIILIIIILGIIPQIYYILTLQRVLNRCSPDSRTLSPRLVWLLIIPLLNLIWEFFVVINLSKSLHNEFTKRNIDADKAPGLKIGLAMCILFIVSLIPYFNLVLFAGVAALICWIIYWVKISGYSAKLQHSLEEQIAQPGTSPDA